LDLYLDPESCIRSPPEFEQVVLKPIFTYSYRLVYRIILDFFSTNQADKQADNKMHREVTGRLKT